MANILCLPLWTDYDVMGFIRTPFNKEAFVNIIYTGVLTGGKAFSITSSEPSLDTPVNYSYGKGGQQYAVDLPIRREWKPYSLTLKAHTKGSIEVRLQGPYLRNDYGEIYSIVVDYRHLRIRDKEIFTDQKRITYTKHFLYRIPVRANDAIQISFEVRRHRFEAKDFSLLKTRNVWYIITLSILVFAISYCLLQRVSKVSRKKQGDAVFLVIFFLLLAYPLSDISDAQMAVREGRTLKKHPKVSLVFKEGANFGKEYDNWFCDHIGGRAWLIKLHDAIQQETQRIIRGPIAWYMQRNGWIFDNLRWQYLNSNDMSDIVKTLVELEKFCEMNHIKLYVFVVPRKESIYQEQLYGYGMDKQRGAEEKFHEQIKHLAARQHVTYIYPWTELREARRVDYVFFKLTHHWTDWGAYIGYRALMTEIRQDFPDIPVVSLEDYYRTQSNLIRDERGRNFHTGNLIRFFGFENDTHYRTTLYNYYDHKNADKLTLNMNMESFTTDFRYGGGAYKIMVIGTSQNENLMNFLPYSAARAKYIRLNAGQLPKEEGWKVMKYHRKEILSYKPDALILSIYEGGDSIPIIKNIFEK